MNITFLIGNGFDRNLGLKTLYSDFIEEYNRIQEESEPLKQFHESISKDKELWSSAEEEMGKYTAQFMDGEGALFYQCHKDFCEKLAEYLKREAEKMEYQYMAQDIERAFTRMNDLIKPFPTQERRVLEKVYADLKSENIIFNFIVYNYTDTLDKCVSMIRKKQAVLGNHMYGSTNHNHTIGEICHVHGTVETQMVLGVNDKSQIAKPEIFECEYGDLYEDVLIKRQANQGYQENTDAKAKKLIDSSQIIYIYGMSIGITDALWWERICAWLQGSASRHLIVHCHSMPTRGLLEVDYKIEERKKKQGITKFSKFADSQKREIENRIHVTGDNLFLALKDIAKKEEQDKEVQALIYDSIRQTEKVFKEGTALQATIEQIEERNKSLPTITVV